MKILNQMALVLALALGYATPSLAADATKQDPAMNLEISSDAITAQGNRYYSYSFGHVRLNWSQWADFYVRNTGSTPLYVQGVFMQGEPAFRAWSDCPAYLYPGRQCTTRVEFRPWHEGYHMGRLRFSFTGGNSYIDLSGWGTRY